MSGAGDGMVKGGRSTSSSQSELLEDRLEENGQRAKSWGGVGHRDGGGRKGVSQRVFPQEPKLLGTHSV